MKKMLKSILKMLVILLLISLPFISITQMIGLDRFVDSFENPQHYICVQNNGFFTGSKIDDEKYILIQKSSYPNFQVSKNDYVVYSGDDGSLKINKIDSIENKGAIKIYNFLNEGKSEHIFENQIIGKVIGALDNNIWNALSMKIWDISVHNLNIRALITD